MHIDKFFTSGWELEQEANDLRSKFQIINISILLSSLALIFGIVVNTISHLPQIVFAESLALLVNIVLFFLLRICKKSFSFVTVMETFQFTVLFLFLIYTTEPSELKYVWVFTYPLLVLYFRNDDNVYYWVLAFIIGILIAPLQPFVEVHFSMYQTSYIAFVVFFINIIIYFYQKKIDEAKKMIIEQQNIMNMQSKHAVMGEMISMIAHQWRQPLSTVTLSISNIQIKRLLGEKVEEESFDKALENISDTIVYLSDTIDDFQTFFRPNREISTVEIDGIIHKTLGFIETRLKDTNIEIKYNIQEKLAIQTYFNELVQVILNILNNAVDELLAREISSPKIIVSVENQDLYCKIIIEDNAGGIAEENIEKIFDPYFSLKGKNGTGLGLYMSQMIMQKQFSTKIDVTNSKNGACFAIIVPKKLV